MSYLLSILNPSSSNKKHKIKEVPDDRHPKNTMFITETSKLNSVVNPLMEHKNAPTQKPTH
tara:strand:+ start:490 stop:672 length:183 start_codon:yes stop_codon:yes gene_type:complete